MQYSSAHGSPFTCRGGGTASLLGLLLGRTARCAWNTLSWPAIFFSVILAGLRVSPAYFLSTEVGADESHDELHFRIITLYCRFEVASKKAKGIIDMLECRTLHIEVRTLCMLLSRSRRRVIYITKALQILLEPSLDLGDLL